MPTSPPASSRPGRTTQPVTSAGRVSGAIPADVAGRLPHEQGSFPPTGLRYPAAERTVSFRPRSILVVLGVLMAVAAAVGFIFLTSSRLTLIAISVFLALALNPAVEFFLRRGLKRHWAVVAVYLAALALLALLVLVFIPPLVAQIANLAHAAPGFVTKLSEGNGPAGVLERRYQVVERIQAATNGNGLSSWTAAALSGLDVIKRIATSFVGTILIAFLTLFMLLEGPAWRRRLTDLLPDRNRASLERIGSGVYQAVGGFVTGNLLASLAGGVVATVLLLITGVPYALPLGLFVVIVELIPYIGPAIATVVLPVVALLTEGLVPALIVLGVLLAYHIIEGHTLRPLIYGRALKLSPLAVLIAIVLGTELAGILGALAAIPVAGAIQVTVAEVLRQRRDAAGQPLPVAGSDG
ncbi:MAG: AI-2E family transporter [Propionibacteriaceae bacterium]|nr:AI-2E family transporter [Propionibacteriaceae bacterium]